MQNSCQNSPLQIPQTFIPLDLNEQLVLLCLLDQSYNLTAIRIKNLLKLRINYTIKLSFLYTILDNLKRKGLIKVIPNAGTKIYFIEPLGKEILKRNITLINWMKEGVEL